MKKKMLLTIILAALFTGLLFSFEIELSGGLGNLAFDKDLRSALSGPDIEGTFDPKYYPLLLAQFTGEYNSLFFSAGFSRDPLLRNRLYGNLRAGFDYFFIEAGPSIGIFNSPGLPINPGISAALGLSIPGKVFARAAALSTIGARTESAGGYSQLSGEVSAGFWVPHVICSLNMSMKNYALREEPNLLTEDDLKKYFFRADVFTKNVPFTMRVDLGFQNLSRSYSTQKIDGGELVKEVTKDEFKSFIAGLEGVYTLNSHLKFYLGGEMPVYSWGKRPMKDPSKDTILFEAKMGVILNLSGRANQ